MCTCAPVHLPVCLCTCAPVHLCASALVYQCTAVLKAPTFCCVCVSPLLLENNFAFVCFFLPFFGLLPFGLALVYTYIAGIQQPCVLIFFFKRLNSAVRSFFFRRNFFGSCLLCLDRAYYGFSITSRRMHNHRLYTTSRRMYNCGLYITSRRMYKPFLRGTKTWQLWNSGGRWCAYFCSTQRLHVALPPVGKYVNGAYISCTSEVESK